MISRLPSVVGRKLKNGMMSVKTDFFSVPKLNRLLFIRQIFYLFFTLCTRIQKYLLTFRLLNHCIKYIFHLTLSLFLLNYYRLWHYLWYYLDLMYYAVISFIARSMLE